jgi:hypothetical protein
MTLPTEHYDAFRKLTDEQYEHCTLTEKLTVYLQHHPIRAVAFLEELVRIVYPTWEQPNDDPSTD